MCLCLYAYMYAVGLHRPMIYFTSVHTRLKSTFPDRLRRPASLTEAWPSNDEDVFKTPTADDN